MNDEFSSCLVNEKTDLNFEVYIICNVVPQRAHSLSTFVTLFLIGSQALNVILLADDTCFL